MLSESTRTRSVSWVITSSPHLRYVGAADNLCGSRIHKRVRSTSTATRSTWWSTAPKNVAANRLFRNLLKGLRHMLRAFIIDELDSYRVTHRERPPRSSIAARNI